MPKSDPTTPPNDPDHYIQHTPQLSLHNSDHEQPSILIFRLPQSPTTSGYPHDTQHPPTIVHRARHGTHTPTPYHTGYPYTKYPPTNGWLDMRPTHAPHQPHHHIPRAHPHPHTHQTTCGITLTIPSQIRNHGVTRRIRHQPHA